MKIVNISGGLGNQMFQYAFAVFLTHLHPNEDVYIDTQHYHSFFFKKFRGINLHNGFEIRNIFPNARLPIASFKQLSKVSYYIPNYVLSRIARKYLPIRSSEYIAKYEKNYSFDRDALSCKGSCYYEGYWQCIKYYVDIKSELKTHFRIPKANEYNKRLIREITDEESVGIHVRRGDYLNEPEFRGICNLTYYRNAIKTIKEKKPNAKFYIFSNDTAWCKENLLPIIGKNCVFVTENIGDKSCWDMFLMTYCKNLIIANSSFSWWGAFLNSNNATIYAPYPWIHRDCELDIYEDNWIKIPC